MRHSKHIRRISWGMGWLVPLSEGEKIVSFFACPGKGGDRVHIKPCFTGVSRSEKKTPKKGGGEKSLPRPLKLRQDGEGNLWGHKKSWENFLGW